MEEFSEVSSSEVESMTIVVGAIAAGRKAWCGAVTESLCLDPQAPGREQLDIAWTLEISGAIHLPSRPHFLILPQNNFTN